MRNLTGRPTRWMPAWLAPLWIVSMLLTACGSSPPTPTLRPTVAPTPRRTAAAAAPTAAPTDLQL